MRLEELFEKCWEEHWNQERFIISGHAKEVKSKFIKHINPAFGSIDYLSITRLQIREFHKTFLKIPVTGNRILEILSKLYKFSIEKEINSAGYNPCVGIKHFTERKRRRYASEAEIKKVGEILDRLYLTEPIEVTFLWTLMFTGARPRSIERARWDELSEIDGFGVLIFDGKSTEATGDQEQVIIPPNIMVMIKSLPRRPDGLIFGIGLPSYLWRKIREEAGCQDLWARDFRRSFATVGMSSGVDMKVIGKLLNHHSTQTTDRYALLNNSAQFEANAKITEKMKSILKK